ncbi:LAO/AO transport system ATPase [Leadbetterella byssophila DSM 17132]|uniref:LAO/AO transport system ATPase n=1 Tax=Leadbetterella byssophila (strain DSM 17132 / JCM 16389 / KACC 11308 / NBRC 106382 / 4M15) TaxID=649349 RepID=E4RWQ9_LEAB4|nr:methylmalonyl Co-A mutase-associated GTPase MeaB [Leadbetterella byssophila]ADQ16228.1 LAO/AO transport system ATPase [Leadbetterella byssophila DSM 17132]
MKALIDGIIRGERPSLAKAITLLESSLPQDRQNAAELLRSLPSNDRPTLRIGVTGVPGVGKSTLIESLGLSFIQDGHKVAVLAIDPSSTVTGGSILGDKTRMQQLSQEMDAFIRPSPSKGTLGGLSEHTLQLIKLVEAAGFDRIIVETVGVGQSETDVKQVCDLVLLLTMPTVGDELQGVKRGIMERVDLVVVNKIDLYSEKMVQAFSQGIRQSMHLYQQDLPVFQVSAESGRGMEELVEYLRRQEAGDRKEADLLEFRLRLNQLQKELWDEMVGGLQKEWEEKVLQGGMLPEEAAWELLNTFKQSLQ